MNTKIDKAKEVRGAHAPRVLVSAPSPKQSPGFKEESFLLEKEKVRDGETPSPAREGACAPRKTAGARLPLFL
jgi:hypothetical protein